jgi:hypothetical protein
MFIHDMVYVYQTIQYHILKGIPYLHGTLECTSYNLLITYKFTKWQHYLDKANEINLSGSLCFSFCAWVQLIIRIQYFIVAMTEAISYNLSTELTKCFSAREKT